MFLENTLWAYHCCTKGASNVFFYEAKTDNARSKPCLKVIGEHVGEHIEEQRLRYLLMRMQKLIHPSFDSQPLVDSRVQ